MKRFTETTKWDDPWFRKLPPQSKLLWLWLLDKCDNAGIIDPDIDLASFQIGAGIDDIALKSFDGRLVKIKCGKLMIAKFIPYQYGNLSRDCKAHNPIFQSLEKHGIKGYPKGINTLQEKEKEKEEEKEAEEETEEETETEQPFDKFWAAYPKKKSKGDAEKAWAKLKLDSQLPQILTSLEALKKDRDWIKDGGQFIPHPATWLNAKGWNDEVIKPTATNPADRNAGTTNEAPYVYRTDRDTDPFDKFDLEAETT